MAFVIADRVAETTTTTGTGALNLAGATTGFQSFVAGVGNGNTTFYVITDNTDWEIGIGTITSGAPDTLSRDSVLQSSNSDAAVNWGSGTKDVFSSVPADRLPTLSGDNTFSGASTFDGIVTLNDKLLTPDSGELTISAGEITVTGVYHTIDTESDASSDDLVTINGGADGQDLILRTEADARDVTLKTTGNIDLPGDVTLADSNDVMHLIYDGAKSKWLQVGATAAQGALADNALQPGADLTTEIDGAIGFSQVSESDPITVSTGNNTYTFVHGLGSVPVLFKAILRCTTADRGYAVGDELDVTSNYNDGTRKNVTYSNATNVTFVQVSALVLPDEDAGGNGAIDYGDWVLVLRAWA